MSKGFADPRDASYIASANQPQAAALANNVWVVYPLDPAPGQRWIPVAWIALGAIGTGVQLGITGGEKGRVGRRRKRT